MTEDVEAIAAKLTKAQREVIAALGGLNVKRKAISFSGNTVAALRFPTNHRPALTDRDMARNHGRRTAWYFLTPVGQAVRAHLVSKDQAS